MYLQSRRVNRSLKLVLDVPDPFGTASPFVEFVLVENDIGVQFFHHAHSIN